MRILYHTNAVIPSRSAHSTHGMKMCQAFARNGHEVTMLVPPWGARCEPRVDDIFGFYGASACFHIEKPQAWEKAKVSIYWAFLASMTRILARVRPHIVYGPFVLGCYVATLQGYSTILEAHVPFWQGHKFEYWSFKRLIKSRKLVKMVAISQALKDIYLKAGFLSNKDIQVAHNAAEDKGSIKPLVDWPGRKDCLQVGYVGHLYPGRGIELIISLAKKLPNIDFHLVGGREEDLAYWRNSSTPSNVIFHGYVPQQKVGSYEKSCHILLAPYQSKVTSAGGKGDSSTYMSPMKVFEYMAARRPIIASDVSVVREVLNDSNAILVPSEDITAWQAALECLRDESTRNKLALKAFEDFKEKYQWEERARAVLDNI